jgi:hypothetical protein
LFAFIQAFHQHAVMQRAQIHDFNYTAR